MIVSGMHIWKDLGDKQSVLTMIDDVRVGDRIAVYDTELTFATVRSVIPVFAKYTICGFFDRASLVVADDSTLLTQSGFELPRKNMIIVCGSDLPRIASIKTILTSKKFYSILLDNNLAIVVEDGYVIK